MANSFLVPAAIGLMGNRQRQGQSLLGLLGGAAPIPQADQFDEMMFARAPNGYQESAASTQAAPQYFAAGGSDPAVAAQRARVNPLNVLFRGLTPNLSGALDTERARLQAEADRPRMQQIAAENESIARALGPQALLAFRTSPDKLGESLGYGYRPQVIGQGGVQSVAATGQRIGAPQFDEFGNEYRLNDPISGTSTVIAERGPSYAEQAQFARIEEDRRQADQRLNLDWNKLEVGSDQFNRTYDQREREYIRQSQARGGNGAARITEGQAKDGFNASRMEGAEGIISGLENSGFDFGASSATGGQFRERYRQYNAAALEWADSLLRLTTGAAATKDEIENAKNSYFPRIGDSAAVRQQKAQRRQQVMADAIARAGPGYRGGQQQAGQGGIVSVSGPEEARALPRGTRFRTPDGRIMEVR